MAFLLRDAPRSFWRQKCSISCVSGASEKAGERGMGEVRDRGNGEYSALVDYFRVIQYRLFVSHWLSDHGADC